MVDQTNAGADWGADELDAIVADYFAMLDAERSGQSYVKAHHNRAVSQLIGRSHRSIEFKHMNISAVLRNLGMPTIRGYMPASNFQKAILGAIERHLSGPSILSRLDQLAPTGVADGNVAATLFVETPPMVDVNPNLNSNRDALERLVRKFDPTERDARNRDLGKAGEALVLEFERHRLRREERRDLAAKVRWVAQEDGDGAGYDILSFDTSGRERLIEVKTTRGISTTPFFLSSNERSLADERPEEFRIFRVYEYGVAPKVSKLHPPLEQFVRLEPTTYRASFG